MITTYEVIMKTRQRRSKQSYSKFTDHMDTRVCFHYYMSCLTTMHLKEIICKATIMYFTWHHQSYLSNIPFKMNFLSYSHFSQSQFLVSTEQKNIVKKTMISGDLFQHGRFRELWPLKNYSTLEPKTFGGLTTTCWKHLLSQSTGNDSHVKG